MYDDFNTPLALQVIFEICNKINVTKDLNLVNLIIKLSNILGILNYVPDEYLKLQVEFSPDLINEQIEIRNKAKLDKNYELADQIRQQLLSKNIILEDTSTGTSWRSKN